MFIFFLLEVTGRAEGGGGGGEESPIASFPYTRGYMHSRFAREVVFLIKSRLICTSYKFALLSLTSNMWTQNRRMCDKFV